MCTDEKGLKIQPTQAQGGKMFKAWGGYDFLFCRLVLITFLYLSLPSFINPSHKSCKVRLFSGYLHSSLPIDRGGFQCKPTCGMGFFACLLYSLLLFQTRKACFPSLGQFQVLLQRPVVFSHIIHASHWVGFK